MFVHQCVCIVGLCLVCLCLVKLCVYFLYFLLDKLCNQRARERIKLYAASLVYQQFLGIGSGYHETINHACAWLRMCNRRENGGEVFAYLLVGGAGYCKLQQHDVH